MRKKIIDRWDGDLDAGSRYSGKLLTTVRTIPVAYATPRTHGW